MNQKTQKIWNKKKTKKVKEIETEEERNQTIGVALVEIRKIEDHPKE